MERRKSKKRDQVLEILQKADGALSAAEIHAQLRWLDLVTIYRNLDIFVADGIVKRLTLGGKEALYEYETDSHHHAVCTECERVVHFTAPDEKLKKLLSIADFRIDAIEVTVRGLCNHK